VPEQDWLRILSKMATCKFRQIAATLVILLSDSAWAEATSTIFGDATPQIPVVMDTRPVTVGVKFLSAQPGKVSGIRFFRGAPSRTGYAVKLFAANGALLAAAKTWKDTCSVPCWEYVKFVFPVNLAANTTYVAAYYTPNGRYAGDKFGLTGSRSAGPLTIPASAAAAGNGVYTYSEGFPDQAFENSNYYVDVAFTSAAPVPRQLVISFYPPNPSIPSDARPGTVVATIKATWSDGTPFTGTLSLGPPYSTANAAFAISGNNLIFNPGGPGVAGDGGTTVNATIVATQ
jgi:Domain of unknown function (DUF4082)